MTIMIIRPIIPDLTYWDVTYTGTLVSQYLNNNNINTTLSIVPNTNLIQYQSAVTTD